MSAPMSDNELVKILLKSPLYKKLQLIRNVMHGTKPKSDDKSQGLFKIFSLFWEMITFDIGMRWD